MTIVSKCLGEHTSPSMRNGQTGFRVHRSCVDYRNRPLIGVAHCTMYFYRFQEGGHDIEKYFALVELPIIAYQHQLFPSEYCDDTRTPTNVCILLYYERGLTIPFPTFRFLVIASVVETACTWNGIKVLVLARIKWKLI